MPELPPDLSMEQAPEAPPKRGLFAPREKEKGMAPLSAEPSQAADLTELFRRIRTLEERNTNLRTKTSVLEQNMISRHKQVQLEVKTMNAEMYEFKREINELRDRIILLLKELQTMAKREEVKILEKYVNMWEPVRFVTREEVEDIIHRILKDKETP